MHQNRKRLGLRSRPRWGSLQHSPRPPSCYGLGWRFGNNFLGCKLCAPCSWPVPPCCFEAGYGPACNVSSMFFKSSGSLFHEDGPETEKERGPKVLVRVRGMWRLPCAAERSGRRWWTPDSGVNISQRYAGASPRHLCAVSGSGER